MTEHTRTYAGHTIGGDAVAGTFSVPFVIYGPDGVQARRLEGVVDTRYLYSIVPRQVLEQLGTTREHYQQFRRTDGLVRQLGIGSVQMELNGKTFTNQIVFGDDLHEVVIGSLTLAVFGLAADPKQGQLVPGLLTL